MRDRILDKNIVRVEVFIERWKQLSTFLDRGFSDEKLTAEVESEFLELKSVIAQEHEMLHTTLGADASRDDKVLRLLNSVPSLGAMRELPEGMAKKIGSEWHSTYMALQALLGRLRGRQAQLSFLSAWKAGWSHGVKNPVMIMLVAALALYGAYRLAERLVPIIKQWKGSSYDKTRPGNPNQ